ncbi:CCA tRNA nucleotidyltransferase [Aliarcobacter skirrowii]|uniref:CCA tRNA nucleotidyltransferase n=1 Tax=Aliarcobacter skirrowii TaxID=28200 RepID=UPI0029A41A02|nr:CCA tRNA nucleotidyltransferase [Aliarcobacter skirrowii]MDX4061091.1 CCA tRNA nucleotidyltransferase [Aliarcobacter skirrowii]
MFITIKKIKIPKILENIFEDLKSKQAKPIVVGGCVRDSFLNKEIKDYDIEVYNIDSIDSLKSVISKYKEPKLVGKSFGVLKLSVDDFDFDFSLPRTEIKTGFKHTDFEIILDSNLSYKEASRRRDFTINSIGYDYFENRFLDPFGGIKDLKKREIKHIDDKTFIEDSLRVYRALGFASRFNFKISKKTKKLCKKIVENKELEHLPKQRVFDEFKKIFLKSKKPSIALKLFDEFKIFFFSFKSSYKAVDKLAKYLNKNSFDEFRKIYLFFSLILKNQKEDDILNFLQNITDDKNLIKNILTLCKNRTKLDEKELKKLSLVLKLQDLILLEKSLEKKDIKKIEKLSKKLDISDKPLEILVQGKDLISLGFKESKEFKEILDFALNLQIENNMSKDEIIEKIKIEYFKQI